MFYFGNLTAKPEQEAYEFLNEFASQVRAPFSMAHEFQYLQVLRLRITSTIEVLVFWEQSTNYQNNKREVYDRVPTET